MKTVAAILKHKGHHVTKVDPMLSIAGVVDVLAEQLLGIVSERDIVRSLATNRARTLEMTAGQLNQRTALAALAPHAAGSAPLQHQLPGAAEIGHGGLKHRPIDPSGHYRPDGQSLRQVQVVSVGPILDLPSERAVGRDLHGDRRRLRKLVDERVVEPAVLDGDRVLIARRGAHPPEAPDHSIVALVDAVELVSRRRDGRRAADCQEADAAQRRDEKSRNRGRDASDHHM